MKKILSLIVACTCLTASAQKQWTLHDCIDYALHHNVNIKQYEDNVKQQQIVLSTSRNQRLPNLNASAGENFSFGRALTIDNTYANKNTQNTSFSLSTAVPIYTGGQIGTDIRIKQLGLQASIADLQKVREDVSVNVTTAFLEAVYQKDMVRVAEMQVELTQAQVNRREHLFRNGKSSEAEVAQIKSTLAADQYSLIQQKNASMLAILTLTQLLDIPSPDGFDVQAPADNNIADRILTAPEIVYDESLGIKPSIQAEKLRIQSAEKSIRLAKVGHYPTIYANGGLGTSYYKTNGYKANTFGRQMKDNFNQYIGISLNIPIFNRLATRNSVRAAKVQLHTQQLRFEETKKALFKEIQQAYYNALAAQKQCISSQEALKSAQISFDLMQKKYELGKANATEYQEQKTALFKAEEKVISSIYTFIFREKILNFYRGTEL